MEPTQSPIQSPAQPSSQPLPQSSAQPLIAPMAGMQPQAPTQRATNTKTAKIIAGMLAVIAVAGIALGVYGLLTGQSKDQQISDLKTQLEEAKEADKREESDAKCVATISLEDVRTLLSKYLIFDFYASAGSNIFEHGLTDYYKYYLSLKNLNYNDRVVSKQDGGPDGFTTSIYDFTYDELNDLYHGLFGSASDVQNQKGWCGVPFFSQDYDGYVSLDGCGGIDPSSYAYEILNYYTQDDELTVDVVYFHLYAGSAAGQYVANITVGENTEEISIFDPLYALKEHIDQFPKYELKFTKENGNYILSAISQI